MDPASRRTDGSSDVLQERDDIVIRPPLDFSDLRDGKACLLANLNGVFLWNLAKLRHRFAGEGFNFQPDFEFALVRPKLAHRRPGITIDHSSKIKAGKETESVLYAKKRRFRGSTAKRRFLKAFYKIRPSKRGRG